MPIEYSVILPAYNEATTVTSAIRETAAVFGKMGTFEIVVVDDGSTDATAETVQRLVAELPFLRLVQHPANAGKGSAVKTGVSASVGNNLLFLDCDLATHPGEAPKFAAALENADIVIGSRRVAGAVIAEAQPLYRSLSGRAINLFVRLFLGLPQHDTQCGFKMFRAPAAKKIFAEIGPSRWTFDVEVLLRAAAYDYKIVELPVTWRHGALSRVRLGHVLSDLKYLLGLKKSLKK